MDLQVENEFLNKKAIITGASSGIGRSVATCLLNSGATVALVGSDVESLKSISKHYPNHSTIITCDLTHDIEMFDLKSSAIERLGTIDILVNCAGIKFGGDIEKTFPDEFDYTVDINLRSAFFLTKCFETFYSKNASIVNVSCLYGTKPMYGLMSYCMSKAGLEAFTKCAAAEYADKGIRINCVSACPVMSNSLRYIRANEIENDIIKEKMKENVPMGRIALPDDVAKVIMFLCSKRASTITGQVIKVDGGRGLTSSGYIHYKGYGKMNTRFEPDGYKWFKELKGFNMFGLMKGNVTKIEDVYKLNEKELDEFIKEKIKESNFSTRDIDAHKRIHYSYKNLTDNNQKLYSKFILNQNNQ